MDPALLHRGGEEPEPCLRHGPVRRCELGEHVVAVATLIDHGLDTAELPFDTPQSLDDLLSVLSGDVHAAIIPPGGINRRFPTVSRAATPV